MTWNGRQLWFSLLRVIVILVCNLMLYFFSLTVWPNIICLSVRPGLTVVYLKTCHNLSTATSQFEASKEGLFFVRKISLTSLKTQQTKLVPIYSRLQCVAERHSSTFAVAFIFLSVGTPCGCILSILIIKLHISKQ